MRRWASRSPRAACRASSTTFASRGDVIGIHKSFFALPWRSIMSNLRLFDPAFGDNFDTAFRRFFAPAAFDGEVPELKMRVDVTEKDNAYEVKADIPGVKKEDINVRIDGNVVQIDAEV